MRDPEGKCTFEVNMNEQNNSNRPPVSDAAKGLGICIPVAILCIGFLMGCLWFLRPEKSETEKRDLTDFPELTLDDFLSGEFTDGVSLWYADTFPGREGLIGLYHRIQSLYGLRGEQFQYGGGDEIPDETMGEAPDPSETEPEPDRPVSGGEGGEQVGGYYLSGDTAYELYAFNDAGARRYAALINKAADKLAGRAKVYDLIVPLHYSVALSADVQDSVGVSDGGKTINFIYSGISDGVGKVDVYGALMAHRDEYLYFRTDHHWTATGAYYAYEAFCRQAGITPTPLASYEKLTFEGFLGTLYSKTREPAALRDHPDVVEAYVPMGTNSMVTHTQKDGIIDWYSIVNRKTDEWYTAAAAKYNCFIAGDNPLTEIRNEHIAADRKGTSVLLIKESFGNAFAPFLVDSYEYVYIIDYRYYDGDLADFVTDHGVKDVIFLNNIVATTGSARLAEMEKFVGN